MRKLQRASSLIFPRGCLLPLAGQGAKLRVRQPSLGVHKEQRLVRDPWTRVQVFLAGVATLSGLSSASFPRLLEKLTGSLDLLRPTLAPELIQLQAKG